MAQLLSNLPIGAKVKFGKYSVNGELAQDIVWIVLDKNHSSTPSYPSNSVTLLSEKIVDLRSFDAKHTTSGKGANGLARYAVSNIRQWLNSDKEEGLWYAPQLTLDTPPIEENVTYSTPYNDRPGFLNAFSTYEKNAIIPTTIRCKDYQSGTIDITDKVYLLSAQEALDSRNDGWDVEGTHFSYFWEAARGTSLTEQAYTYSSCTNKPITVESPHYWWTRSGYYHEGDFTDKVLAVATSGVTPYHIKPLDGSIGIRPALNLSSTTLVSDVTDVDGYYRTIFNSAPNTPSMINVPSIYGGKSNSISWSAVTDPDGDAVTYQLECSIDGGEYTQIYKGASTGYAHLVTFGTSTVSYRVKATDTLGESSDYTTSTTLTVFNNNAPVISGADANLGVKSEEFTGTYTVTDANSDVVTITEAIDGVQIRSLVATLGEEITYGITENTWLALPNGSHTLTITATDGIDTTVRRYTFTKLVESFTIQNSTPWVSSTMPTRIMLVVTRNIPSAATFKVEVCNNGYDTSPTWEDATDAVRSGLVHVFANTTKTATNWGVLIKVTVERNGAVGACYISAIGGNFE